MILFLDTTNLNKITLALIPKTGKVIKITHKIPYHDSHTTLEHIDRFLKSNKVNKSLILNLKSIIFCSGPGSFTGIRVAASICQALAFAWNLPIRTIKKDKIPKNLKDLTKLKLSKKLTFDYGRPAT